MRFAWDEKINLYNVSRNSFVKGICRVRVHVLLKEQKSHCMLLYDLEEMKTE